MLITEQMKRGFSVKKLKCLSHAKKLIGASGTSKPQVETDDGWYGYDDCEVQDVPCSSQTGRSIQSLIVGCAIYLMPIVCSLLLN